MAELKYAHRIISDALPVPPELKQNGDAGPDKVKSSIESTHVMSVDSGRLEDFFYVDCRWLWKGSSGTPVEQPHTHDFDEVICFVGSNREDPHDLGGEITIWLDDDKHVMTRSCLIYVPAGTRHCPVQFNRIDTPVCFVTISPTGKYSRKAVGKDAVSTAPKDGDKPRYTIITETKEKFTVAASGGEAPPIPRDPSLRSTRLLHLEDDMAKGAFYVDFVWIWEGNGGAPAPEHDHQWPELIAMTGADPANPHDLGGKMSIVLGDELHVMDKSSLVCIPAGLKHCPWKFIGITKPTLVFTAGPSAMYSGSHKKEW
ncbi:MAG: cupin domain-containing protein [Dehalococcoidales bacterium]|nr:cupin domain-containing protein [Dehalococcoidales bacterium]